MCYSPNHFFPPCALVLCGASTQRWRHTLFSNEGTRYKDGYIKVFGDISVASTMLFLFGGNGHFEVLDMLLELAYLVNVHLQQHLLHQRLGEIVC